MTESQSPIASPCIKVCVVDPLTSVCVGCGRTLQEIGGWLGMSEERRAAVMAALPARLARLHPRNPDAIPD
ncbi:putative Fe-S protein [Azorhizobium caulinodans ORS 571]|uniref:Putative Fe-S protein n=1 Tax=Azorhizobium caulinodans (strain ATCC 43989 / DSM 5975 / JCM 20966 / LMG 6465 / NBRC 14845 / NCIMB 13405 / ORS 571) TaxID=438753 RepID=A8ID94_AZOC5|nr:DUF1289 domain-containing protein [Azorhizobium caulinodans]BAF88895.1 putative Fe-S protein [Azorhizobium caulinodans ORS 571]